MPKTLSFSGISTDWATDSITNDENLFVPCWIICYLIMIIPFFKEKNKIRNLQYIKVKWWQTYPDGGEWNKKETLSSGKENSS